MELPVQSHPLLEVAIVRTEWPQGLGQTPGFLDFASRLAMTSRPPVRTCDRTKAAVRDLLRHGGFKPTGRSKPASEYLLKARDAGFLGEINPAVDACNVASIHSGLPISVVDLERAEGELHIGLVDKGVRYVFNASDQEIDVGGLVCLHDEAGPCGGPVKDSHRTKTQASTTRTLSVVWGTLALEGRTRSTAEWYQSLIEELGGQVALSLLAAPADLPE